MLVETTRLFRVRQENGIMTQVRQRCALYATLVPIAQAVLVQEAGVLEARMTTTGILRRSAFLVGQELIVAAEIFL